MSSLSCFVTGHRWRAWEEDFYTYKLVNGYRVAIKDVDVRWCSRCSSYQTRSAE